MIASECYCTEGGLSLDDVDLWARLRSMTLVKVSRTDTPEKQRSLQEFGSVVDGASVLCGRVWSGHRSFVLTWRTCLSLVTFRCTSGCKCRRSQAPGGLRALIKHAHSAIKMWHPPACTSPDHWVHYTPARDVGAVADHDSTGQQVRAMSRGVESRYAMTPLRRRICTRAGNAWAQAPVHGQVMVPGAYLFHLLRHVICE
eukprot:scaffold2355_cov382-Prasinococcus_capsulatus_cf.AAC.14